MSQTQTASLCLYNRHTNGIHEYVLVKPTREGFDDLLLQLDRVFQDSPTDEQLRSLMDFSSGFPPLQYSFQRTQVFLKKYPNRTNGSKVAYLYTSNTLISMMKSFISLFRLSNSDNRFFSADERDAALRWLAEG
jgi:hypothetical protein